MRDKFIETTNKYGIMGIINRKPAVLYRNDSAKLSVFIRYIEKYLITQYEQDYSGTDMYENINIFHEMLHIQSLSIEATLNRRYDYDDESAFIIMEEENPIEPERASRLCKIPEITTEIVLSSNEPLHLLDIAVKDWGSFRNEMNILYNEICAGANN